MKKLTACFVTALLLMTFNGIQSMAASTPTPLAIPISQSEEVGQIVARMNEIKALDKTSMTASEKKALRKEVRAAKRQLNSSGGGVYISVGAIIIIILLLILLL